MIHLDTNEIELDGKRKPIDRWEVWFVTMDGLCSLRQYALDSAEKTEMPVEMIRPIPVAVAADGTYEVSLK